MTHHLPLRQGRFVGRTGRAVGRWSLLGACAFWAATGAPAGAKSKATGSASASATVSLQQVAKTYGFQTVTTAGKRVTLGGRFNTLVVEGDSRRATYNGVAFWLSGPIARKWGRWTMLQSDVDRMLAPLARPTTALTSEAYRVVLLDAGHGGDDKGANALSRGLEEKKITLALAKKVQSLLKASAVEARLTRTDDRRLSLEERCALADRAGADLFISIHVNAAEDTAPAGIETHVVPPAGCPITSRAAATAADRIAYPGNRHDAANMVLGYTLQKSLLKHTGAEDRGVRRSRFFVVKNVDCPAALIECGFISNRAEGKKLLTAEYQDRLARAIAEGIIGYVNSVKRAHHLNP